ncbi:MAG: hypothetical protein MJ052_04130 [Sphaerochaetaceae bacterium]|nr:hypothetical protein [Sphaerochaetaceae bacterium]
MKNIQTVKWLILEQNFTCEVEMVEFEKHTCINCRFYQPGAHYDCHENVDELVKDKNRPNFCESFSLSDKPYSKPDPSLSSQKAKQAFDSFFNI